MTDHKHELELLLSMSKAERKLFLEQQRLEDEEGYLLLLMDSVYMDNYIKNVATKQSIKRARDYKEYGTDEDLEALEVAVNVLENCKQSKRNTLKQIKVQRERVRWQRNLVQKLKSNQPKKS